MVENGKARKRRQLSPSPVTPGNGNVKFGVRLSTGGSIGLRQRRSHRNARLLGANRPDRDLRRSSLRGAIGRSELEQTDDLCEVTARCATMAPVSRSVRWCGFDR